MQVWEKFDRTIDTRGLVKDIKEAEESSGEYKKVPLGNYEVAIEKLELVESKKGDPMVTVWFEIVAGEYKNSKLFYNQVIKQGMQIHIMNEFLRSLGIGKVIKFESYTQYAELLEEIHDNLYGKLEYGLEYAESKPNQEGKTFTTYKITDIFELTQSPPQPKTEAKRAVLEPIKDDEELPF